MLRPINNTVRKLAQRKLEIAYHRSVQVTNQSADCCKGGRLKLYACNNGVRLMHTALSHFLDQRSIPTPSLYHCQCNLMSLTYLVLIYKHQILPRWQFYPLNLASRNFYFLSPDQYSALLRQNAVPVDYCISRIYY